MRKLQIIFFILTSNYCFSQNLSVDSIKQANGISIYPKTWWIGMKNPHLQVMVRGKNFGKAKIFFTQKDNPGIKLDSIQRTQNPNYLFLNFTIGLNAKPGKGITFDLHVYDTYYIMGVPLDKRTPGIGKTYARGINSSDFIYLLMPDRFSNGDPNNDHYANMRDTVVDRNNPLGRHGGDLQGIINHLDYFQQLGVTALWLTPVIENDMPLEKEPNGWLSGYHGYWFTDHYEIDKRYGGKEAYLNLVKVAHAKGLKIIQDAVYNHIGAAHWIMSDPPSEDWINRWPGYQGTNHREQAVFDIHGSAKDKEVMEAGWFVPHLPDLNLRNPLLANYLIQQAIWMTEEFQLDGWRVDTYKYCDPVFLNNLNSALEKEFPKITSFGEAVVSTVADGAYFCKNNLNVSWKSNLSGILDFPVCYAMLEASKKKSGWNEGVNRLYTTLAEDMLYKEPMNNCIFLDNHDMDRFYSVVGEDFSSFRIGMGLLLTMRGAPHLYYGTEILMKNFKNPSDAAVREDFPGGFAGDPKNKFLPSDRTDSENLAFNYISKLANFRKTSSAIKTGALMQFIPSHAVYTYFRYDLNQTILCTLNSDTVSAVFNFGDFAERTKEFDTAVDVITGSSYPMSDKMIIPARSITILELKKRRADNKVVH